MTLLRSPRPALSLLLLALLGGCDLLGEEPPEGPAAEELFPLAEGNRWVYSQWYLMPTLADTFVVEITDRLTFEHEGETLTAYVQANGPLGEESYPWRWLYGHGADGLYLLGGLASTDTMLTKRIERKSPLRVGQEHRFTRLAYDMSSGQFYVRDDTLRVTLLAREHPFETPRGVFTCSVYWYEFLPAEDVNGLWNVFEYYTPGIGKVAEVITNGRTVLEQHQTPEVIPSSERDDIVAITQLYDYRIN